MSPKDAFEQLYKENYSKLASYCYFYLKNKHDTEDVVQETYLKAWSQMSSSPIEIKRAWLYAVAKNHIMDKFKSYENVHKINNNQILEKIPALEDIEEQVSQQDDYKQIEKALETLPADQKEAIILKYLQEFDYDEIAEIMQKTVNNIRVLIHRGLATLKLEAEDGHLKALPVIFMPTFIDNSKNQILNQISSQLFIKTATMTPVNNPVLPIASTTAKIATSKLIAIITTSVIVVAGIGGGVWYFIANSNKNNVSTNNSVVQTTTTTLVQTTTEPVITTTVAVDPYANWNKYQNTKYGYSFSYPKDWVPVGRDSKYNLYSTQIIDKQNILRITVDKSKLAQVDQVILNDPAKLQELAAGSLAGDNQSYQQFDIYVSTSAPIQSSDEYVSVKKIETIKINGTDFDEYEYTVTKDGDIPDLRIYKGEKKKTYVTKVGTSYINISFYLTGNKYVGISEQIVKSFTLITTPVDPYAGWKSYNYKEFGISIMYPSNWIAEEQDVTNIGFDSSNKPLTSQYYEQKYCGLLRTFMKDQNACKNAVKLPFVNLSTPKSNIPNEYRPNVTIGTYEFSINNGDYTPCKENQPVGCKPSAIELKIGDKQYKIFKETNLFGSEKSSSLFSYPYTLDAGPNPKYLKFSLQGQAVGNNDIEIIEKIIASIKYI